ncbi:lysylphosphatidylglycerol synthase transmembrane domain-containing protein [Tropicimonas sp. IMCC6043]|uniref:lysylphosphatidylglycerol synthase transmembrane domain-containing protein n=1 Tax=Tropicimonas sp. IMCC6043 TaxID=2510645 RepID=UPI00101C056C|nr:lysylphosphatidylglycerol synthase transmembrane domain-containing protein [Tropicimonas sp. IMCC6043]RYH10702.1 flippase-like domain-containing protein [Tropicimonas sp. IMCC6043]
MSSPSLPPPQSPASQGWRDVALLGGLLCLFLAGLAGLATATGWEETLEQIRRLSWLQVAALLGLSLCNYLLRSARWHVFARSLGLPTRLVQDIRHFLGGFAMTVTPGRVGELIRMRWLRRETGWSFERTAPLVLVDRASDLAAMGILLAIALAFSTVGIGGALPVVLLALGAAYVATHPRLLAWVVTQAYRALGRWPRIFGRIRQAARSLRHFSKPGILTLALALGTAGWLAEGYAFHLLLGWMGAEVGLWSAVAIFVFSTLAGGLTGAPGGVGGAEAAMIALLKLQGVPLEVSVPATAVIRLTTLWFAILIGLAVFPIAERQSKKARHDLEAM